MAKSGWPLTIRRLHKWLALLVGLQIALWTLTGFYMVAVHIDTIHGDNLVRTQPRERFDIAALTPPATLLTKARNAHEIRLQGLLGRPVWRVETDEGALLHDARTGTRLPPLSEADVRTVARRTLAMPAAIVGVRLLTTAPLEMQSQKPPFWQVEFAGWNRPTLYISATTGEVLSRRHLLWRVFDFAWMLHIMDYQDRTNVNNPLLRVATWIAFGTALSGAWLLFWSFKRRRRKSPA